MYTTLLLFKCCSILLLQRRTLFYSYSGLAYQCWICLFLKLHAYTLSNCSFSCCLTTSDDLNINIIFMSIQISRTQKVKMKYKMTNPYLSESLEKSRVGLNSIPKSWPSNLMLINFFDLVTGCKAVVKQISYTSVKLTFKPAL